MASWDQTLLSGVTRIIQSLASQNQYFIIITSHHKTEESLQIKQGIMFDFNRFSQKKQIFIIKYTNVWAGRCDQ